MSKYIWMEVTRDKYELPIHFSDDYRELAKQAGVSPSTVRTSAWKRDSGKCRWTRFCRIAIKGDDDE